MCPAHLSRKARGRPRRDCRDSQARSAKRWLAQMEMVALSSVVWPTTPWALGSSYAVSTVHHSHNAHGALCIGREYDL
jgi:hypothetical protein